MDALMAAYRDLGGKPSPRPTHNPCPLCEDKSGFSLWEENGLALWKCHSKCAGLSGTIVDLLMHGRKLDAGAAIQEALTKYGNAAQAQPKSNAKPPKSKEGRYFPDALQLRDWWAEIFAKDGFKPQFEWKYERRTPTGGFEPALLILRFKHPETGKKEMRPNRFVGNGWRIGLGEWGKEGSRLPLYNLRALDKADPESTLHVVEGEKCADALLRAGLLVTTPAMGSSNAKGTEWLDAARFASVVIWKDLDAPAVLLKDGTRIVCKRFEKAAGEDGVFEFTDATGATGRLKADEIESLARAGDKFAADVAGLIKAAALAAGRVAPAVAVVDLRSEGLTDGEDVADLVERWEAEGKDAEALKAGLEDVADRRALPTDGLAYDGWEPVEPLDFAELARNNTNCISNYRFEKKDAKDDASGSPAFRAADGEDGDGKKSKGNIEFAALRSDEVIGQIVKITGRSLARLRSQGTKAPTLFYVKKSPSNAFGMVDYVASPTDFASLLDDLAPVRFAEKTDFLGRNFVSPSKVFHSMGRSPRVNEYLACEVRPHWPKIPGHFYQFKMPDKYQPDGSRLLACLKMFDNIPDPAHRAVTAALFLTPGWGGAYGARPLIVIDANEPGSGKTELARAAGKVWGGIFTVDLSQKRGEEELRSMLLSTDALTDRVALFDNVRNFTSTQFESLITDEWIGGKRMYVGYCKRPNSLTWIITANGLQMTADLASRTWFVHLNKPTYRMGWKERLYEYIDKNWPEIVADCLWILQWRPRSMPKITRVDRWADWVRSVFVLAAMHPALREWVGAVDVDAVLAKNQEVRALHDLDRQDAETFWEGLLERLAATFVKDDLEYRTRTVEYPTEDVFVASASAKGGKDDKELTMRKVWGDIMGLDLKEKSLKHVLDGHIAAGRLPGLKYGRNSVGRRGWLIAKAAVEAVIQARYGALAGVGSGSGGGGSEAAPSITGSLL